MYKLMIIAGPNRGTSYLLKEGELSIGRQGGNTVVLQSSKVSKQHCILVMSGSEVTVKDQGSSNGTFVNGVLTKIKKLKIGDRISVGEFVFELVEPPKKAAQVAPAVAGFGNVLQIPTGNSKTPAGMTGSGQFGIAIPGMGSPGILSNQPPKALPEKIIWYFENHVMPVFYGLNLKHEWRLVCLGMFAAFALGNLVISVYPLLESSRTTIVKETGRRARFMARQIVEQNSGYMAARAETKTEIGMIETAEGVKLAVLADLDSRVIAPGNKMNQYLTTGGEALWAIKARDMFRSGKETGFSVEVDSSTVLAIEPLKVMNPAVGKNVIVAMAIVSVDTSLSTPDLGEMGVIYSETLILTGLLGGIILLILYRLTLKPFQTLNEDLDKALKGEMAQVTREFKFEEMNSLWDIINSAIQRVPKSDNSMAGQSTESSGLNVDEVAAVIKMVGALTKFGLVFFDSSQKIMYLNPVFEEISGIRLDGAIGQEMSAVARDQAMGAFTSDILGRTSTGGDEISEDFDFSGISYKVYANAGGSPGGTARCFMLAVVKVEA